jgi:hypothetical protein
MKWELRVLLDYFANKKFAAKVLRFHEGSIFRNTDFVRTELEPVLENFRVLFTASYKFAFENLT